MAKAVTCLVEAYCQKKLKAYLGMQAFFEEVSPFWENLDKAGIFNGSIVFFVPVSTNWSMLNTLVGSKIGFEHLD